MQLYVDIRIRRYIYCWEIRVTFMVFSNMKFSTVVMLRSIKAARSKIISKTCDAIEKQRRMLRTIK